MVSKIQKKLYLNKIKWKSDAIFNSFWLEKFISNFFNKGKKVKIEKMIYSCFYKNRLMYNISIVCLFFEIIEALKILITLIIINQGNKLVFPKPLKFLNQYKKAITNLNQIIQQSNEQTINLKIISEFLFFFQKHSKLYLQKENTEKLSYQNHSLKRYRWQI